MRSAQPTLDERLVDAYPALLRYSAMLTKSVTEAEDLLHEAMVRCLDRRRSAHIELLEPYMRRTIVNVYLRRAGNNRYSYYRDMHANDGGGPGGMVAIEAVDQRDVIRRLLDSLTPRQKVAVVSRYYLDLSERDTATAMRCSIGTVKALTSRGLSVIREQICASGQKSLI